MSLRSDIQPYIDGMGLIAPNAGPFEPNTSGSDNGPMYTSEYYILLHRNGEATLEDAGMYFYRILRCIDAPGLLNRVPRPLRKGQTGPDDYYGVLSGSVEYNDSIIPRILLKAVFRYQGFLNNVTPGQRTARSFLIRQPQLLAAIISASFPSRTNPLHLLIRALCFPLFLFAALILLTSCYNTPIQDTDSRRLAFHLGNATQASLMCRLAYIIWQNRLYTHYKAGMIDVAAIYYEKGHPFAAYRWD